MDYRICNAYLCHCWPIHLHDSRSSGKSIPDFHHQDKTRLFGVNFFSVNFGNKRFAEWYKSFAGWVKFTILCLPYVGTGWSIIYVTITKFNNFAYLQQIFFIFNAYYDVIDDFIAIYNIMEMALSSMLYIVNDVILCRSIIYFPVIYFLT